VSPEEPIVVTVDPMRTSWDSAPSRPSEAERELASFPGSAVVQVVQGDAHRPDAVIAELHSATVRITDQRVLATDGDIAWAWLVTDLAAVVHGADAPWTIFDVPGISDFGVAVPADEVDRFREVLGRLPGVDVRHQEGANGRPVVATAPAHEPASAVPASLAAEPMASFPPPDPDTGPVPLVIAEASAVSSASLAPLVAAPAPVEPLGLPGAPDGLAGLDARDISAWFGDHQVLDRVSLHMEAGKVTALIGPSGCGKSTFLRILNRMHEMIPAAAMAGEVLLDGHDLYDANRKLTDARREVGMVFQKPNPVPLDVDLRQRAHRDEGQSRCEGRAGRVVPQQGGAVERGEGPPAFPGRRPLGRSAATPLHRPCARDQAAGAVDGRAVFGTRSDLDASHRGDHHRARARGDDRDRHAQHAAGCARIGPLRVLPRQSGHARCDRRARPHRCDVQRPAGRSHARLRDRSLRLNPNNG
jgi:hypothetical protein